MKLLANILFVETVEKSVIFITQEHINMVFLSWIKVLFIKLYVSGHRHCQGCPRALLFKVIFTRHFFLILLKTCRLPDLKEVLNRMGWGLSPHYSLQKAWIRPKIKLNIFVSHIVKQKIKPVYHLFSSPMLFLVSKQFC